MLDVPHFSRRVLGMQACRLAGLHNNPAGISSSVLEGIKKISD
jgi:hypothetical protein